MIITVDKKQKTADLTPILDELYLSFKKINLPAYKDLQRAAGFVAYKAHQNDHPLAWGAQTGHFPAVQRPPEQYPAHPAAEKADPPAS